LKCEYHNADLRYQGKDRLCETADNEISTTEIRSKTPESHVNRLFCDPLRPKSEPGFQHETLDHIMCEYYDEYDSPTPDAPKVIGGLEDRDPVPNRCLPVTL
jgi:hypothetical protein